MKWIDARKQLPKPGVDVLICQNSIFNDYQMIMVGNYVPKHFEENNDSEDWFDYDEKTDTYYLPEGWYENQWNWGEYARISIGEGVTHWMPLPEKPNKEKQDETI